MYPASFQYVRAESLAQALDHLRQHGEEAKVLAGGASLIPLMKLRLASPAVLVDIGRCRELAGIRRQNGAVVMGALTHHAEVEENAEVCSLLPILHDVASKIGDTQIRNMGTVGGSLAEADPAGDWAPALLALRGAVRVSSTSGERTIPADELFLDAYTTSLRPEEIVTEVIFPFPGPRSGSAHAKFEIRAGDFAVANCSVAVVPDDAGRLEHIGIGLGAVGLQPLRVTAAEDLLRGQALTPNLIREAATAVATCTESYSDVRGSADYRRRLGAVMFERALNIAIRRATGEPTEVPHG